MGVTDILGVIEAVGVTDGVGVGVTATFTETSASHGESVCIT